jgi:hypothetical protein
MSLDFNFNKIEDKSVLFIGGKVPAEGESGDLNSATQTCIWMTMHLGINPITEANYEKFYERYVEYMTAHGENDKFWALKSADDVKARIGLSTNASKISDAKFKAIIKKMKDR